MKLRYRALIILCILSCFAFVGCGGDGEDPAPPPAPLPTLKVTATDEAVSIKDTQVAAYDFTQLFTIVKNGESVEVLPAYIDSSAVKSAAGSYFVFCSYEGAGAQKVIDVIGTVYKVELDKPAVTIVASDVEGYDFKRHFTVTADGEAHAVTDDMISSDVKAEEGEYTYTVAIGNASKTLDVSVLDNVMVVPAYKAVEVELSDLASYDYTKLFSLYVDGEAVKVTKSMLEIGAPAAPAAGDEFDVTLTHGKDGITRSRTVRVKAVADAQYAVSSKNIITYTHGSNIDLTSLFEIKRGAAPVPVTTDMVSGVIDYALAGTYPITLTFNGQTYTADVTVKDGVVVNYAAGDTIFIKKGTVKADYPFANDFVVVINGARFYAIPDADFIGLDAADFDKVGDYEVTLSIPYCTTQPSGLSGNVTFERTELTVTYAVRERIGTLKVKKPVVTIAKGVDDYNVFSNLMATVNGLIQLFVTDKSMASAATCYAEIRSDPIDYTVSAPQKVKIAVYLNGPDAEPEIVEYEAIVKTDIDIVATDTAVFTGETVLPRDLFTVTAHGKPVKVTNDMISGKVDTFAPGIYTVTLDYDGATADATVTVFDNYMKGKYRTWLTTIASLAPAGSDDDDDDYGSGWGDSGYGWDGDGDFGYYSAGNTAGLKAASRAANNILGDLVIADDGSMRVNGYSATVTGGTDEKTILFSIGSNAYTMHYEDGIAVLEPDNSLRLGYTEARRPMIYFNEALWTVDASITVNYGSKHVLADNSMVTYTIEAFHIKSVSGNREMWYGLYVRLAEKTSSDTIYVVKWGEVKFAPGFKPAKNVSSSFEMNGDTYRFTMSSASDAKVVKGDANDGKYSGMSFTGTVDGASATLTVNSFGAYELRVGASRKFYLTPNDIGNLHNAYIDYAADTVLLYGYNDDYKFSFKFLLDTEDKTFTVAERDPYYGKYETAGKYIYMDGYGTGIINFTGTGNIATKFRYSVAGGLVTMRYFDTLPTFTHGETAEFYMGEFLNTLTVKSFVGTDFDGVRLQNSIITTGAIVDVGLTTMPADGAGGKQTLLNSISITTAAGTLDAAAKAACVDTKTVSFTTPGFYRYSIKLGDVTAYYSIEILKCDCAASPYIQAYGAGKCSGRYSLTIADNGIATIERTGKKYLGFTTIDGDSIHIKAYDEAGRCIIVKASPIADGILYVACTGADNFFDYFTTGSTRVVGTEGYALREFTVSGVKTYVLSGAASTTGRVVSVSGAIENGGTVTVVDGTKTLRFKIDAWGNTTDGMSIVK